LTAHGRQDEPWIALDDAAWQFKQHRDHLVACTGYVGFDANAESRLRAALLKPRHCDTSCLRTAGKGWSLEIL
jgi:hypothetical protein